MKTNDAAVALICEFEGFEPRWYPDPAHGWKVPTIGFGHTDAAGYPRYADDHNLHLAKSDAITILKRDLAQYERAVTDAVKVPVTENQFGALVSFTYNLGPGNLRSSTLLRKLNAGDYAGAAGEFGKWVKAGGKTLNGLVRRRAAERALFEKPVVIPAADAAPSKAASAGSPGFVASLLALLKSMFGGTK